MDLFARFNFLGLFYLSQLEKSLLGKIFANIEELGSAVVYFEDIDGSDFKQNIEGVEHGWEKFIELKLDQVEK